MKSWVSVIYLVSISVMGSLVVPPHSVYKFPVNLPSMHRKKHRKSRDVYSRQDCPEDFWESHIRRHHSSLNLIDECINHNVAFLSKVGQFSSLENLSSKVYNERRDARYYVQEETGGGHDHGHSHSYQTPALLFPGEDRLPAEGQLRHHQSERQRQPRYKSEDGCSSGRKKGFRKFLTDKLKTSNSEGRKIFDHRKSKVGVEHQHPPCQHLCQIIQK